MRRLRSTSYRSTATPSSGPPSMASADLVMRSASSVSAVDIDESSARETMDRIIAGELPEHNKRKSNGGRTAAPVPSNGWPPESETIYES